MCRWVRLLALIFIYSFYNGNNLSRNIKVIYLRKIVGDIAFCFLLSHNPTYSYLRRFVLNNYVFRLGLRHYAAGYCDITYIY